MARGRSAARTASSAVGDRSTTVRLRRRARGRRALRRRSRCRRPAWYACCPGGPSVSERHFAQVQPDTDAGLDDSSRRQRAATSRNPAAWRGRRASAFAGAVPAALADAETGHHAVAGHMKDLSAVRGVARASTPKNSSRRGTIARGREPLRQSRIAPQVREQHRARGWSSQPGARNARHRHRGSCPQPSEDPQPSASEHPAQNLHEAFVSPGSGPHGHEFAPASMHEP